jgi:hypothetical protein
MLYGFYEKGQNGAEEGRAAPVVWKWVKHWMSHHDRTQCSCKTLCKLSPSCKEIHVSTCWYFGGWGELASPLKVSALLEWRLSFLRRIGQLVNLSNGHLYRERTASYMLLRKCIFQRVFFFFFLLSSQPLFYYVCEHNSKGNLWLDWGLDQKAGEEERVDSLFVQMEFMPFTPSFAQLRVRVWERERERKQGENSVWRGASE